MTYTNEQIQQYKSLLDFYKPNLFIDNAILTSLHKIAAILKDPLKDIELLDKVTFDINPNDSLVLSNETRKIYQSLYFQSRKNFFENENTSAAIRLIKQIITSESPNMQDGQLIVDNTTKSKSLSKEPKCDTPNVMLGNFCQCNLFSDPPTINDVIQGGVGNCAFVAAVRSLVEINPKAIENMMHDNGDNTVSVRLFDKKTSQPVVVTTTKNLYRTDTKLVYGHSRTANIWFPILEKAVATFHSRSYEGLTSISQEDSQFLLVGEQPHATVLFTSIKKPFSGNYEPYVLKLYSNIEAEIANGAIITAASRPFLKSEQFFNDGIFSQHSYSINGVETTTLKLYDEENTSVWTKNTIAKLKEMRDCMRSPLNEKQFVQKYDGFIKWSTEKTKDITLLNYRCYLEECDNQKFELTYKQADIKFIKLSNPHGKIIREYFSDYVNYSYHLKAEATISKLERSGSMSIELNDFVNSFGNICKVQTTRLNKMANRCQLDTDVVVESQSTEQDIDRLFVVSDIDVFEKPLLQSPLKFADDVALVQENRTLIPFSDLIQTDIKVHHMTKPNKTDMVNCNISKK